MALLELTQVTKRYGGIIAVNEATFAVEEGTITSLIGPNGAGKTTAFDTISGVIEVDGGTIAYDGKDITGLRPNVITKLGVGRTFQVTRELGNMTVMENLAVASVPNSFSSLFGGRVNQDEYDRAMDVLDFLGIKKLAHELAKRLSYGQRKLLELASVLMTEPKMILLDEPAGGVNPALLDRILDRIQAVNANGITFLIVEHNMDVVMKLSDSIVVMAAGKVLTQDVPEAVRNDERVLDAYLGEA